MEYQSWDEIEKGLLGNKASKQIKDVVDKVKTQVMNRDGVLHKILEKADPYAPDTAAQQIVKEFLGLN